MLDRPQRRLRRPLRLSLRCPLRGRPQHEHAVPKPTLTNARRAIALASAAASTVLLTSACAEATRAHTTIHTTRCGGTLNAPGVLAGTIHGNVVIDGVCEVKDGNAVVDGSLTVSPGSTFVAAYAHDDLTRSGTSKLSVTGDLTADRDTSVFVGCEANRFTCLDDSKTNPTLSEPAVIGGQVDETGALGVVLHDVKVGGSVEWNGGGADQGCTDSGFFDQFDSGPWFDIEDSTIGGELSIGGINGCWLGVLRVHVAKSFTLVDNHFEDPDAIEIGTNMIGGNLACSGNSTVWDTTDLTNNLYPRQLDLNTVHGTRSGQCRRSSRLRASGLSGQYPF